MRRVGQSTSEVINTLGLNHSAGCPIYIGETNIAHMKDTHPVDYEKYGLQIEEILSNPDYVGLNPKDGSIEYVKEFLVEREYVKVAVRIAHSGKFYARSIYVLNTKRVQNFIRKGTLKRVL